MDLFQYFDAFIIDSSRHTSNRLDSYTDFFDEEFNGDILSYDVFIIGVPEDNLSLGNENCASAPDKIRLSLYELYEGGWNLKILDLGNLRLGKEIEDTYAVLKELTSYLIQESKVLLVLGGGHDLILPIFRGHSVLKQPLSFASADAYLDFQDDQKSHSKSFLSQLISSEKSLLSKYFLFGYQTYLCDPKEVRLLKQMKFNLLRLGEVNSDIKDIEPYIRCLDHLSIDLSVLKSSVASATPYSSPNGMSAEGLCSMVRYAGLSFSVKSILFSNLNPLLDKNGQSSKVYAQAIWYFLEGLHLRRDDFCYDTFDNFKKFHVNSELSDLLFYKNLSSNKWWFVLPGESKLTRDSFFPCSFMDYKKAVDGELSDRILGILNFK